MKKSNSARNIYDFIGIGFGPSNLALAIALEERAKIQGALNVLFLDKQRNYSWHGNTLVAQSELQISFLKDLVSLRNPTSPYSFVNYLHKQGRLVDFINLGAWYPGRVEFNDYLRWVAAHFSAQTQYGEEVINIEPVEFEREVTALRVTSRNHEGVEQQRITKSLAVSTGGTPFVPPAFRHLQSDSRVFHHARYLENIRKQVCVNGKPMKVAIIGSGQSAAEAFIDLNDSYPSVSVEMILRGSALKPADSSPFVNEIFSPEFTDIVFKQTTERRESIINEYHNTNYSVVDLDLIERIYAIFYRQKVVGEQRHQFRKLSSIEQAIATDTGINLTFKNTATGAITSQTYDAVILATGYERKHHYEIMAPLADYLKEYSVDRDYRIKTNSHFKPAIYMQGFCESSHGLSDTLLSVLPIRADDIAKSLYEFVEGELAVTLSNSLAEAH